MSVSNIPNSHTRSFENAISFFEHRACQPFCKDRYDTSVKSSSGESKALEVDVSFQVDLPREQLHNIIQKHQNTKVVFWYIGAYGLKQEGVSYYKEDIGKIQDYPNNAEVILYDLTAWAA